MFSGKNNFWVSDGALAQFFNFLEKRIRNCSSSSILETQCFGVVEHLLWDHGYCFFFCWPYHLFSQKLWSHLFETLQIQTKVLATAFWEMFENGQPKSSEWPRKFPYIFGYDRVFFKTLPLLG